MNSIKSVKLIKNIRVKNVHHDMIYPYSDIIEVVDINGDKRILDLWSDSDITDIDYYEIITDKKTKEKVLFNMINERGE